MKTQRNLFDFYLNETGLAAFVPQGIKKEFFEKVRTGNVSIDEDPQNHFVVFFVPVDVSTNRFLLIYNKKLRLWLFPGGHLEVGESSREALEREVREELGLKLWEENIDKPFCVTKTRATDSTRSCVFHYDLWYLIKVRRKKLNADSDEFKKTMWAGIKKAKDLVTDKSTLCALDVLERIVDQKR